MYWSQEYETGLQDIDVQHRQVFEMAAAFEHFDNHIQMMEVLANLCKYMSGHFREEEALLAASGYPATNAHIIQHDEFRKILAQLLEDARHMNLDQIADRVRPLVNDLVQRHIQETDFDFILYLKHIVPS